MVSANITMRWATRASYLVVLVAMMGVAPSNADSDAVIEFDDDGNLHIDPANGGSVVINDVDVVSSLDTLWKHAPFTSKLYVLGGYNDQAQERDTSVRFDASNWSHVSQVAAAVLPNGACAIWRNRLYFAGGIQANGAFSSELTEFDGQSWQSKNQMNRQRTEFAMVTYNGKLHAIGGRAGQNPTGNVETWSDQKTWGQIADLNIARLGHCAVVYRNAIYVIGGEDSKGNVLKSVETFQEPGLSWKPSMDMLTARTYASAVVFDDRIIVAGGLSSDMTTAFTSVEAYDGQLWTAMPAMQTARFSFGLQVLHGTIYAMGGTNSDSSALSSVEALANSGWVDAPSLPYAVTSFCAAVYPAEGETLPQFLE